MANPGQAPVAPAAAVQPNPFRGRAQVVPLPTPPEPEATVEEEVQDLVADEGEEDVEETPDSSSPSSVRQVITDDDLRQRPQRLNELRPKERTAALQRLLQAERDAAAAAVQSARQQASVEARQTLEIQQSVAQFEQLQQEDPAAWAEWSRVPGNLEALTQAKVYLAQQSQQSVAANAAHFQKAGQDLIRETFGANPQALQLLATRGEFPATAAGLARLTKAVAEIEVELRLPARTAANERQAAADGLRAAPKAIVGSRGGGNEPLTFESLSRMTQPEMNALLATPDGEKRVQAALAKGPAA